MPPDWSDRRAQALHCHSRAVPPSGRFFLRGGDGWWVMRWRASHANRARYSRRVRCRCGLDGKRPSRDDESGFYGRACTMRRLQQPAVLRHTRPLRLLLAFGVAASNRVEHNSPDAGLWGGPCTCPDGQIYWVGDGKDECNSLACVNGVSGECKRNWGGDPPAYRWRRRKVECSSPPPPQLRSASECDGTVAYTFLTRDVLPLWPAWTEYFDSCPRGSALPLVHSQDISRDARASMASILEPYGGHALPANETLQGNLRFRFAMVRAQMRLYLAANQTIAHNGCTPRWVVTLSERDAPARSCGEVHRMLAERAGVSFLEAHEDTLYIGRPENLPREFSPLVQTSQWVTLWLPHAAEISASEAQLAAKWQPTLVYNDGSTRLHIGDEWVWGAFDEWMWVTELGLRGFPYGLHGLTMVIWCDHSELFFDGYDHCEHADNMDWSSPAAFTTTAAVTGACRAARSRGYYFIRKVGNGTAEGTAMAVNALKSDACIRAPALPPLAPPPLAPPPLAPSPATPPTAPEVTAGGDSGTPDEHDEPAIAQSSLPRSPPSLASPRPSSPALPPAGNAPPFAPAPSLPLHASAVTSTIGQLYDSIVRRVDEADSTNILLACANIVLGGFALMLCCLLLRRRGQKARRPMPSDSPLQPVHLMAATPSSTGSSIRTVDDRQRLTSAASSDAGVVEEPSLLFGYRASDVIKWISLPLLVVQNSSLFLVMRYSRSMHEDQYHPTVTVFVTELVKFTIALSMVIFTERKNGLGIRASFHKLHSQSRLLYTLAVPALCFTGQNNLLYVGVSYLSAAAAQVIVQSKTLWAALFSVLLLKKRFSCLHWTSFVLLVVGVVLVQNQDTQALFHADGARGALVGVAASLAAATLSGFAGVFLEMTFTRRTASLWELNVHLAVLSLPLQGLAIFEFDRSAIYERGFFYGYHADTWLVIFIQAVGGLLTAVVIKYAGNMLKSFATSLSLMSTSLVSIPMLGYNPSSIFWAGLFLVCTSTMLYASPTPQCLACSQQQSVRTAPHAADEPPQHDDVNGAASAEAQAAEIRSQGRVSERRRARIGMGSKATRFWRVSDEVEGDGADADPEANSPRGCRLGTAGSMQRSMQTTPTDGWTGGDNPPGLELAGGLLMATPWLDLD